MIFKITRLVFILISTGYMLKFAIPKLLAMPISVKSFTQFSEVLSINTNLFMYFTGIIELVIVLLLVGSLLIKKVGLKNKLQIMGYLLLFFTMIGAILVEQFVRPAPKSFLMTIALVLITICISELSILSRKKGIQNDNK